MASVNFTKFIMVGGLAAAVNIAARSIFELAMSFEAALVLAYLCGTTIAFALNRRFVFRPGAPGLARRQAARFASVNAAGLVQVWLVGVALARVAFPWAGMTWHPETVAHVLAGGSPVVTSYFAHKHYSFAHPPLRRPAVGSHLRYQNDDCRSS